jgi:ribosomal protein S27E
MCNQLKKITLTIDGSILELRHGHFGYIKCADCENSCERVIEWKKLFCTVCPRREDCHEEGVIADRKYDRPPKYL